MQSLSSFYRENPHLLNDQWKKLVSDQQLVNNSDKGPKTLLEIAANEVLTQDTLEEALRKLPLRSDRDSLIEAALLKESSMTFDRRPIPSAEELVFRGHRVSFGEERVYFGDIEHERDLSVKKTGVFRIMMEGPNRGQIRAYQLPEISSAYSTVLKTGDLSFYQKIAEEPMDQSNDWLFDKSPKLSFRKETFKDRANGLESINHQGKWGKREDGSEGFEGKVLQTQTYKDREDKQETLTLQGKWGKREDGSWGFVGNVIEKFTFKEREDKLETDVSEGQYGNRGDGSWGFVGLVFEKFTFKE